MHAWLEAIVSVKVNLKGASVASRKDPLMVFETAFDRYEVWSVLGEGGAGKVFLATRSDGLEFALKALRPEVSSSDKRKRFKNEIDFLSKNRHKNIIRVIDSGLAMYEHGSAPFYVMPRLRGTLRSLLNARLASDQVLPLYSQILDGIEAAHLFKVTHRDIKPENVLHHPDENRLLLADFGIAHFEEEEILTAVESKHNDRLANFLYAAPEQRVRNASVDHRADIYALGLLLNEMFTGAVPQGTGYRTIASTAQQFAYLDPLVEAMIQQQPGNRPNTIEEIKKELLKRENEFLSLQRLDEKRREVVPTYRPDEVVPINLLNVEWDGTVLTFTLSRPPEQGWITRFKQPRDGHSSVLGKGPEAFQITGNKAHIHAEEHQVQPIVNHFKTYLTMATAGYQRDLQEQAQRKQYEERERLRREQELAERRARVMQNLTF